MAGLDDLKNRAGDATVFAVSTRKTDAGPTPEELAHYLVIVQGAEPGKRLEIGAQPITIGRDAQQSLALADAELSRRHARVSLVDGRVVAEDLGSTNGTFLEGQRLSQAATMRHGHVLRMGSHMIRYERRSRTDVQRDHDLGKDLARARAYVEGLLPPSLQSGAVQTDWRFVPSTQLGGDAFGYDWLDPQTFAFYLLDVAGHGAGSAMHSVAVLNVLRQRALPGVDFTKPAEVLGSLNDRFQMDNHGGMFFTMWYGVYHTSDRRLEYGSAGHHPAYLVASDRDAAQPLGAPALMIGAMPGMPYDTFTTRVPEGASVYVFSDGVFEIVTKDQQRWAIGDFLPRLIDDPIAGTSESDRLYQAVQRAARPGPLDDDFSILVVTFR